MRDVIIYAGGFGLPDRTGSAHRCMGNVQLWQRLGLSSVVLGKLPDDMGLKGGPTKFLGADCYDIRQPFEGARALDYAVSVDPIRQVVDHFGAARVRAVVLYNYPARGFWDALKWGAKTGVPIVSDCTEWYPWEGPKFLRNVYRQIGMTMKAHVLNRMSGNLILASQWMQDRYPQANTLVMPGVYDAASPRFAPTERTPGPVRFFYGGSPGTNLRKDSLSEFVASMAALKKEGHAFRADIVGLSDMQFLAVHPEHAADLDLLSDRVTFHGRLPHETTIKLLKQSDFLVFFRQKTRQNEAGFSGKYIEAAMCGIPVITNATSDLALYQNDGVNGFLAPGISLQDVHVTLRRAVQLKPDDLKAMRQARLDNVFDLSNWETKMTRFLDQLQGVRGVLHALRTMKRVPLPV